MSDLLDDLKSKHRMSFVFGLPGIILQGASQGNSLLLMGLGTLLLIAGLSYYARMKGHHWALGFLGLLSIIGFLVLYFIPSTCRNCGESNSHANNRCDACNAPVSPGAEPTN